MAAEKTAFLLEQMGDASLDTYARITAVMAQQTGTVVPPGSWYLSILGITPSFQGQGLGGVRWSSRRWTGRTNEAFTPTWKPTRRETCAFMNGSGFRTPAVFDEPVTNARYWVMVRMPSSSLK
jgi:hypothetical protein